MNSITFELARSSQDYQEYEILLEEADVKLHFACFLYYCNSYIMPIFHREFAFLLFAMV